MNDNNTTPAMKEGDTVDFEYHTEQDVITGTGKIIWINNNDCVVETQKGKSKPKRHMMEISALKNTPLPDAQPLEGVKTAEADIWPTLNEFGIYKGDTITENTSISIALMLNKLVEQNAQFATDAGGGKETFSFTKLSDGYPKDNTEVVIKMESGVLHNAFFTINNNFKSFNDTKDSNMGYQNKYIAGWVSLETIDKALKAPSTHSSSEMVGAEKVNSFNLGYLTCLCNLLFARRGEDVADELMNANDWFTENQLKDIGLPLEDIEKLKTYKLVK